MSGALLAAYLNGVEWVSGDDGANSAESAGDEIFGLLRHNLFFLFRKRVSYTLLIRLFELLDTHLCCAVLCYSAVRPFLDILVKLVVVVVVGECIEQHGWSERRVTTLTHAPAGR